MAERNLTALSRNIYFLEDDPLHFLISLPSPLFTVPVFPTPVFSLTSGQDCWEWVEWHEGAWLGHLREEQCGFWILRDQCSNLCFVIYNLWDLEKFILRPSFFFCNVRTKKKIYEVCGIVSRMGANSVQGFLCSKHLMYGNNKGLSMMESESF